KNKEVVANWSSNNLFHRRDHFPINFRKKEEEPPWEVATTEESLVETTESTKEVEETTIMVDVKGAVKKPGVYELKKEARLKEAILLAGGMKEEAERSEEHTSELQSRFDLVCRLLLEKKKKKNKQSTP